MKLVIIFWILLFILFYTYIAYALILFILIKIKALFLKDPQNLNPNYEPKVCLFVTAFNEKDYIKRKVENSFSLDYPKRKIQYLWITDGSNDGTPELLQKYKNLEVHHLSERKGKMHAMNRGMQFVKAPIVIFSDSNTTLGKQSIRAIVAEFSKQETGCVAGEKRIVEKDADSAAGAGESVYWKFESWIKNMDAKLNSAVGAAGELFAIRTHLFKAVETDTILDDFIISMRTAQHGFRIAYAPNAYAEETASLNVKEELKRKIRITAGGIQAIFRLKSLLNPFRNSLLSWQYFSHKVLRWTLAPVSLFLIFVVNILIVVSQNFPLDTGFYTVFLGFQLLCYSIAILGWMFEHKQIRLKIFFIPYYFVFINYASVCGIYRYFNGKQSVNWEKSKRS